MKNSQRNSKTNRREFLQESGAVAAATTVLPSLSRSVHVAGRNSIRLALIGCGPRGTGAVRDALSVKDAGPVQLFAMADLNDKRIEASLRTLNRKFSDKVDVPADRQFLGFDAYKKAVDLLEPGDIAMCTTRAYIRPVHVEYAVQKGINVFMEKPFASDPGGIQRIMRAGELAEKNNVKIAAGLQCRHSPARQALIDQIQNGQLGDIHLIRANRLGPGNWLGSQSKPDDSIQDQLNYGRIHLFWIGSGHMVDYLIHQIDECCWIKGSWPVSVRGLGGRVPESTDCGQNLDVYSMEYTFEDGTKAFCGFRRINKTEKDFATYIHGTKCAAQFSGNVHAATVHRFKDQRINADNIAWTPTEDEVSPWQYEWNDFIESIRLDRVHNEAKRAAMSDLATLMGRAACHTGQTVTWEEMMKSRFQFCNYLDELDFDSPTPIKPDENGQFEVPVPGKWKEV
jgi:predicted dehydrogenase